VATEAAWHKCKNPQGEKENAKRRKGRKRKEKKKKDLTLTGLLMEGPSRLGLL
jgi:hypothetical protein